MIEVPASLAGARGCGSKEALLKRWIAQRLTLASKRAPQHRIHELSILLGQLRCVSVTSERSWCGVSLPPADQDRNRTVHLRKMSLASAGAKCSVESWTSQRLLRVLMESLLVLREN